jgi:site-specific DNA-methyltransferase (adenine-specific)
VGEKMSVTLYCGDCLEVMKSLPDGSIDAVVTDPPYSSGGQFRGDRTMKVNEKYVQSGTDIERPLFPGDNRDQRAYGYWCALWLSECWRIAKAGAPICLFTDWRQLPTTTDVLQAGGWVWRGIVPWNKTEAARPMYGRFRAQCEYVVWGSKGPMALNNGGPALPGFFTYMVKQADKYHMTGKPTALMIDMLAIADERATILDPFMGSGTTGVACVQTGRNFIGIEIDPTYYAIAEKRIAEAQMQPALPIGDAAQ